MKQRNYPFGSRLKPVQTASFEGRLGEKLTRTRSILDIYEHCKAYFSLKMTQKWRVPATGRVVVKQLSKNKSYGIRMIVAFWLIVSVAGCAGPSCYHPYHGDINAFSLHPPHRCVSPDCKRARDALAEDLFAYYPVRVFRVGHSRLISFPTDSVFKGRSANLNRCAFSLLNAVADYLKHDDMVTLEVSAYTDNRGSSHRDRLISSQQAAKVVQYLTAKGIPANFIYAVGWGQAAHLSSNATAVGREFNRRIELRYRVLPLAQK